MHHESAPLAQSQINAVMAVTVFAVISIVALILVGSRTVYFFVKSLISADKRWSMSRERLMFSTQLGRYALCLLIACLCTSITGLIGEDWAEHKDVLKGPVCDAQAVFKNVGSFATAYFNAMLSLHTLITLAFRLPQTKLFGAGVIAGGWILAFFVGVFPMLLNFGKHDPVFGYDGFNCGVSIKHPVLDFFVYLLPVYISAIVCTVSSFLIFVTVSGIVVFKGGFRFQLDPAHRYNGTFEDEKYYKFVGGIAKNMILYSIVYILLVLPFAITESLSISGLHPAFGFFAFSYCCNFMMGAVYVLLLIKTFHVLGPVADPRAVDSSMMPDLEKGPKDGAKPLRISIVPRDGSMEMEKASTHSYFETSPTPERKTVKKSLLLAKNVLGRKMSRVRNLTQNRHANADGGADENTVKRSKRVDKGSVHKVDWPSFQPEKMVASTPEEIAEVKRVVIKLPATPRPAYQPAGNGAGVPGLQVRTSNLGPEVPPKAGIVALRNVSPVKRKASPKYETNMGSPLSRADAVITAEHAPIPAPVASSTASDVSDDDASFRSAVSQRSARPLPALTRSNSKNGARPAELNLAPRELPTPAPQPSAAPQQGQRTGRRGHETSMYTAGFSLSAYYAETPDFSSVAAPPLPPGLPNTGYASARPPMTGRNMLTAGIPMSAYIRPLPSTPSNRATMMSVYPEGEESAGEESPVENQPRHGSSSYGSRNASNGRMSAAPRIIVSRRPALSPIDDGYNDSGMDRSSRRSSMASSNSSDDEESSSPDASDVSASKAKRSSWRERVKGKIPTIEIVPQTAALAYQRQQQEQQQRMRVLNEASAPQSSRLAPVTPLSVRHRQQPSSARRF